MMHVNKKNCLMEFITVRSVEERTLQGDIIIIIVVVVVVVGPG